MLLFYDNSNAGILLLFRMIIHEGNMIIEIEELDVPTSSIIHQIFIGVYLYLYSIHWAFIKNGLVDDHTSTIPITFITIVGMAGRINNICDWLSKNPPC